MIPTTFKIFSLYFEDMLINVTFVTQKRVVLFTVIMRIKHTEPLFPRKCSVKGYVKEGDTDHSVED
jgi:hypothetical protein